MKTALTIAGCDSSGGAGIQADLKTMLANGVYGMSAITALTAQNTTGVTAIMQVSPEFLCQQIDAVFTDIYPDAVKTGMVADGELIEVIAERLLFYKARNIVIDPVMVATSGARLISEDAISSLTERLLPVANVITPNIPEAEVLSGMRISDKADMERAAAHICKEYGCVVLLKGGHSISDADDLLYENGCTKWFSGIRVDNPNTHGTGCTLSSAIASNLAKGYDLNQAVALAKKYISGALSAMLDLGRGSGPLHHGFDLKSGFVKPEHNENNI
ncbi:MAG: bifunctional hydroxymethylpyrimidine kinase/phosphomethylpyrimidine kinase [Ruminiclostridium sp.]|nr:bifunctional hydroxymethylpyrimidine kinase/phosphomethylpyrimidine kinase [Ruminiclostridium sp.]